ncbi:MAG: hypothetical protein C0631_01745 [Sedimenticola sp.]|nr:MAG: hypothetical protein C0631_01745 [Sedimenticola sp.]
MSSYRLLLGISLLLLITACAAPGYRTGLYSGHLPVGSLVEVLEELPLRTEHSRVFLQDGEVVKLGNLNRFTTHCNFELRQLAAIGTAIRPDRLIITGTEIGDERVVGSGRVMLASRYLTGWHWNNEGGPPTVTRFYHYTLDSVRQPDVMRLTCHGGEADLPDARLPTLPEIRNALGSKVRIHLNP